MRIPTPIIVLAATACAAALSPFDAARAQSPDVGQGHALARQWCAGCHQVEAGGAMNEVAPSFLAIAGSPNVTPERLRDWLFSPHPNMPDFNLTWNEVKSIIAYLESLKK